MDTAEAVMDLAKRRGFLWPSFEVYGGAAGFYDYGPLGATMKKRLQDLWRHVFLNAAVPMAEVSCPRVTIEEVLNASGHVDEFTDLVVTCGGCGGPSRADHLVEAAGFEGTADALDAAAIDAEIAERKPKCPNCGKVDWSAAAPQNLMFTTEIGPGSGRVGYLRPETAQGIFTDFPHLLRHFRGRLPFGAIQLGGSNRNEISPRQGMLRLREFSMMEAEVFFTDTDVRFDAFDEVRDVEVDLVPNDGEPGRLALGEAVAQGTICNEPLAYFMATTQRFLVAAGMDPGRLRFRQHEKDEMAHYALDCWDAEFHSERYGWVECVGVADRGSYDLQQHADAAGAFTQFSVPVAMEPVAFRATRLTPNMSFLGRTFKARAKDIAAALEQQFADAVAAAGLAGPVGGYTFQFDDGGDEPGTVEVALDGEAVQVPADGFAAETGTWTATERRAIPHVIEPSFGVDRILWALLEHGYQRTEKNDEAYTRLRLSPHVAPVQVGVLPLTSKGGHPEAAQQVLDGLRRSGVVANYDESGNIGRRYARQDEVGTPVCITIDDQTLQDGTVTLRDRDSTDQERVPIMAIMEALAKRFAL